MAKCLPTILATEPQPSEHTHTHIHAGTLAFMVVAACEIGLETFYK